MCTLNVYITHRENRLHHSFRFSIPTSDPGPDEEYREDLERLAHEEMRDRSDPAIIPPWEESVRVHPVVQIDDVRRTTHASTGEFGLF